MIMFQRRFSNVFVDETEISPTLEAGGGEGGNNLPMICVKPNEPIAFTVVEVRNGRAENNRESPER